MLFKTIMQKSLKTLAIQSRISRFGHFRSSYRNIHVYNTHKRSILTPRAPSLAPIHHKHATIYASAVAPQASPTDLDSSSAFSVLEPALTWPARSHGCGTVSESDVNTSITICGWVDRHRDLGGVLFLDIRDHTGIVQVVVDPQSQPDIASKAERLRSEWVITITGTLCHRKDPNPKLKTGNYEIAADSLKVLNAVTRPLPFFVSQSDPLAEKEEAPKEELRLRHRVLDLRRPTMASNLRLRHALVRCIRRYLEDEHEFIEIETPILTRSTPEGARDYLVPSRVQQGGWYALPQSPQLFKQMLMMSGYDRYYQVLIVACVVLLSGSLVHILLHIQQQSIVE